MINTPISFGELYDKLTILEIKSERIKDENKLANVIKEQELLLKIYNELPIKQYDMFMKLKSINEKLWNIEDHIRIEEKNKNWGNNFIQLARQVYFVNDERAEVKKIINEMYGSIIVEEKDYQNYK